MNIRALVNCSTDIQNIFDELNNESNICKYEILKHTNLTISEDMLIITQTSHPKSGHKA